VTLTNIATVPPFGIGEGQVDCRSAVTWTAGVQNALAVFIRESGGALPTTNITGGTVTSNFTGTGIYFTPATATSDGTLTIAQSPTGTVALSSANSISIGHLVDIQTVASSIGQTQGPDFRLESIAYTLTARHFLTNANVKNYLPSASGYGLPYNNLTMTVNIGLHDNWLGVSMDGTGSTQRLNGTLYYFRFATPTMVGL
jgi:hypothetical protein